jgi:hypothetical protein
LVIERGDGSCRLGRGYQTMSDSIVMITMLEQRKTVGWQRIESGVGEWSAQLKAVCTLRQLRSSELVKMSVCCIIMETTSQ